MVEKETKVLAGHIAVAVVLDAEGRILLGKRSRNVHHSNKWDFIGSEVHDGEDAKSCAALIVRKETGLAVGVVENLLEVGKGDYNDPRLHGITFYACRIVGGQLSAEGSAVHDDFDWWDNDAILGLGFAGTKKAIVHDLANALSTYLKRELQ